MSDIYFLFWAKEWAICNAVFKINITVMYREYLFCILLRGWGKGSKNQTQGQTNDHCNFYHTQLDCCTCWPIVQVVWGYLVFISCECLYLYLLIFVSYITWNNKTWFKKWNHWVKIGLNFTNEWKLKYWNDGWNSRVKISDLFSFEDKKLAKWD